MKNLGDRLSISSPHMRGGEVGSARSEQRTPSRSPLSKGEKSVLFLALSGIGNLVMQLSAISAIKTAHPNWYITVWVAPRGTKEIAESQPYIDEVVEMPIKTNITQHIKNIHTLRKHHFNIGIVLSPGQLIKSALYLKLAGVPIRIGNSYPYKNNTHSTKYLTNAIDEQENMHDIEQNLRLVELLDIIPDPVPNYSLTIPDKNLHELTTYNLQLTTHYVGLHAGCAKGFEFKRWPLERFVEVAKTLIQKNPHIKILVFGGPNEEEQKRELVRMINKKAGWKTLGVNDKTPSVEEPAHAISASLLTTAALMQHCKLVISNDSGLMHVAAACGVPTIGLFGPTDEALTGPRGPKSFVIRASGTKPVYSTEKSPNLGTNTHQTLLAITPQMVIDKLGTLGLL